MIFYFSATGNSEHVAKSIAEANGDKVCYIPNLINSGSMSFDVSDEEMMGFVSPTYYWGLPSIVKEFLENIEITFRERPYTFFIATYGTKNGGISQSAEKILKKRGVAIDAFYEIKMPDSWTPVFDLTDEENVQQRVRVADDKLEEVKSHISSRVKGSFMSDCIPEFISRMFHEMYDKARLTENLLVESQCMGCGRCAENCPVHAIVIENEKPRWVVDECVMCLGCLHHCPSFAIQYGKKTKGHGQYVNPHCANNGCTESD